MVEEYKSDEPIEKRKSQNLTFWDFAKGKLAWQWLPIIAGAVAFTIGKVGNQKIWPMDGSPMIIYKAKEWLVHKVLNKGFNVEVEKLDERLQFLTMPIHGTDEAARRNLEGHLWNIFKGVEISAPFVLYHEWRNKESKKLDLTEASNHLKSLNSVKPTDQELAAENKVLAEELAFEERRHTHAPAPHHEAATTLSPRDSAHEGTVHTAAHHLQPRV